VTHQQYPGNIIRKRAEPVGLAIVAVYPHPNTATASFGANNYNGTDVLKDRADESITARHIFQWWSANVSYLHYASRNRGNPCIPSPARQRRLLLFRKVDAVN